MGYLLLFTVLGVIGAAIVVTVYADLIFPNRAPAGGRRPMTVRRPPAGGRRPAETTPKRAEPVSSAVSAIATPNDDIEMASFRVLAKLIAAGVTTETTALETAFDVKAGSSKAYQAVKANLKKAQSELAEGA